VASKGTPSDAKCVTENPWGEKNKEVQGGKIVARGQIFSLKFTEYRFAAGLRPNPLGELKRSPIPPSWNKEAYF